MHPKRKWTEKGVSPVIGTILMVAITVVLAAVLYVMVIGFTPTKQTPKGLWTIAEKTGVSGEKVSTSQVEPETRWDQCKVQVENLTAGANGARFSFRMEHAAGVVTCTPEAGSPDYTLAGTDLGGDGRISNGDYVTIAGLGESSSYKIYLIHVESGGLICDKEFSR